MKCCDVCGLQDNVRRFKEFDLCYTCRHIKEIKQITSAQQNIRIPQTGETKQVKYTKLTYIVMMKTMRQKWQTTRKLNV